MNIIVITQQLGMTLSPFLVKRAFGESMYKPYSFEKEGHGTRATRLIRMCQM